MKKLIWATAVWGRQFVDYLRRAHVPSLLAPGNFPALGAPIDSIVYTTPTEAREVAEIVSPMARFGAVQILQIQDWPLPRPMPAMRAAMADAVRRAWAADAGLLYTCPDCLMADGFYASVARLVAAGARACMFQGIAAKARPLLRMADERCAGGRHPLVISGPELGAAALAHVHPFTECHTWGSKHFTPWPSMLHWTVPGGRVMHAFHLHPAFVYPRRLADDFAWTLDGDFLDRAGLTYDEIAFLDKGSESLAIEVVHPTAKLDFAALDNTASVERIATWAATNATAFNLRFLQHRFTLVGPVGAALPEVDAVVAAILAAIPPRPNKDKAPSPMA